MSQGHSLDGYAHVKIENKLMKRTILGSLIGIAIAVMIGNVVQQRTDNPRSVNHNPYVFMTVVGFFGAVFGGAIAAPPYMLNEELSEAED